MLKFYWIFQFSDAAARSEEWESRDGSKDRGMVVPLLMQNKVPDGFETDDKLDVSLRPDEVRKFRSDSQFIKIGLQ